MAKLLKNLKMTSVDLVPAGANQHAHIRLFKSKSLPNQPPLPEDQPLNDNKLVDRICAAVTKALAGVFSKGANTTNSTDTTNGADDNAGVEAPKIQKGVEMVDMEFNKSAMTAEDLAVFSELEKKYAVEKEQVQDENANGSADDTSTSDPNVRPGGGDGVEKLHPEVKKALDEVEALKKSTFAEVEELKKSLMLEQLKGVADKYQILGKDPSELCKKLYDIKKSGGTAYDDYIGLLDEQLLLVEKSGVFSEVGKNTSGGTNPVSDIEKAAAQIMKSDASLSREQAFVKACEQNPELLAQYELHYNEGRIK